MKRVILFPTLVALVALAAACGGRKPPIVNPPPAPSAFPGDTTQDTTPPRPPEPPPIPAESNVRATPLGESSWSSKSIDEINGPNSPLKPVFFLYDSDELDDTAKATLTADAQVLKTYPSWVVTIEGHCDERGTAEYNLALGDRRALAARNFLLTLGISGDRLRTVSYGKEFPFDPGHDAAAWAQNRRAHFTLTAK